MSSSTQNREFIFSDFKLLTEIGYELSHQFFETKAPTRRMAISTHFLAKIIDNCISINKLIPDKLIKTENFQNLDFFSIASLSRNLIEASNLHWHISIEKITKKEENLRLLIYDYHDTYELIEIGKYLNFKQSDINYLETQLANMKFQLENNLLFRNVETAKRNKIYKGQSSSLQSQNEIANKRLINQHTFKGITKLLSNHTHSSPTSIKLLGASKLNEEMESISKLLTCLTINYCSSFLADTILNTGSIWDIKFAKKKSENFIKKYSRALKT